jgi:hypothetical protein
MLLRFRITHGALGAVRHFAVDGRVQTRASNVLDFNSTLPDGVPKPYFL